MADLDIFFLKKALELAKEAYIKGEVPVGCVVVKDGKVIAEAYNRRESLKDPTAHAEILALREAGKDSGNWRLEGCSVYVTLEPCPMCAYALILARVERLIFGAVDEKQGGVMSLYNLLDDHRFNHRVKWTYKPMEECGNIIKDFFRKRRW